MKRPFANRLAAFFFPDRCAFCGKVLEAGEICPACRGELPYCRQVERHIEFVYRCAAPLLYKDEVRAALLRFKFQDKTSYCRAFAELMAQTVLDSLGTDFALITWAPISRRRLWERGYDQSKLLAQELARRLSLPLVPGLKKIRNTPKQSTLADRAQRAANVSGAYVAVNREKLQGKRVLLVDDILTTGATLSECARTLLMAGAEEVCAICAASAHGNR